MITGRIPLVWKEDFRCYAQDLCVGAVTLDLDGKWKPILSGEVRLEGVGTIEEAEAVVEREARRMLARAVNPGWGYFWKRTLLAGLTVMATVFLLWPFGYDPWKAVDAILPAGAVALGFIAIYHHELFSGAK